MKLRIFVLLCCVYLGLASRNPPWADARIMYDGAIALWDEHRLDIDTHAAPFFYIERAGKKYPLNAPGNILALVPSFGAYRVLSRIPGAPLSLLYNYCCHFSSSLIGAGAAALLYALLRREGARVRVALLLALSLGLGTIAFVYARSPYSEALQLLLMLWVVDRALRLGDRLSLGAAALGGVACGLLVLTKAVNVLPVAVALAYVIWRQRREGLRLVGALAVAAVPFSLLVFVLLAYNRVRTGAWLDAGYGSSGRIFSGVPVEALYGFLLSPGNSLFLFSPPLILSLLALPAYLRRDPARGLLILGVTASVMGPNLFYHSWHGLWCWGPRYLVPLTAVLLLPAAPWLAELPRRLAHLAAVAALLMSGLFVQLLGAAFYWDVFVRIAGVASGIEDRALLFFPVFSPVLGHYWLLKHRLLGGDWLADAPFRLAFPPRPDLYSLWERVQLDWWYFDWNHELAPAAARTIAPLWLGFLVLLGSWAAYGLVRAAVRTQD